MQEMEEGPPEPPCRGRLQTTASCVGKGGTLWVGVVSVCGKGEARPRQVRSRKASANEPLMTRRNPL